MDLNKTRRCSFNNPFDEIEAEVNLNKEIFEKEISEDAKLISKQIANLKLMPDLVADESLEELMNITPKLVGNDLDDADDYYIKAQKFLFLKSNNKNDQKEDDEFSSRDNSNETKSIKDENNSDSSMENVKTRLNEIKAKELADKKAIAIEEIDNLIQKFIKDFDIKTPDKINDIFKNLTDALYEIPPLIREGTFDLPTKLIPVEIPIETPKKQIRKSLDNRRISTSHTKYDKRRTIDSSHITPGIVKKKVSVLSNSLKKENISSMVQGCRSIYTTPVRDATSTPKVLKDNNFVTSTTNFKVKARKLPMSDGPMKAVVPTNGITRLSGCPAKIFASKKQPVIGLNQQKPQTPVTPYGTRRSISNLPTPTSQSKFSFSPKTSRLTNSSRKSDIKF